MKDITFFQELSMAISDICPECGFGEEYLVKFVKKHDTEPAFFNAVADLGVRQKWELLNALWMSSYGIFKPWVYKTLMEVINTTAATDTCYAESIIHERAVDLYEYYKDAFEANKETEQPPSQAWLDEQAKRKQDEAADKILDLIDEGIIDIATLEILPAYKEAVRKRQNKS